MSNLRNNGKIRLLPPLREESKSSTSTQNELYGLIIFKGYVRYNGKTHSVDPCSDPNNLTQDTVYAIVEIIEKESSRNYELYDLKANQYIEGEYTCIWFDCVNVIHRLSNDYPIEGKELECLDGATIIPKYVKKEGEEVYRVITVNNGLTIVQVIKT